MNQEELVSDEQGELAQAVLLIDWLQLLVYMVSRAFKEQHAYADAMWRDITVYAEKMNWSVCLCGDIVLGEDFSGMMLGWDQQCNEDYELLMTLLDAVFPSVSSVPVDFFAFFMTELKTNIACEPLKEVIEIFTYVDLVVDQVGQDYYCPARARGVGQVAEDGEIPVQ